jgi:hypothetical protein
MTGLSYPTVAAAYMLIADMYEAITSRASRMRRARLHDPDMRGVYRSKRCDQSAVRKASLMVCVKRMREAVGAVEFMSLCGS